MAKLLALLLFCSLFLAAAAAAAAVMASAAEIAPSPGVEEGNDDLHRRRSIAPSTGDHEGRKDGKGNLKPSQCSGECHRRCSKTHHRKPCLFFCNKCCAKCLCVPPGYYGNKETCPCYNNWKTKRGGPKCP